MQYRLKIYDVVESTNDVVTHLARQGEPEGLVVQAEYQTKGRGRRGRSWQSPKGKDILISILLRPGRDVKTLGPLYDLGTASVVQTLAEVTGLSFQKDEPNDVVIDGKKVAGVLVESSVTGGRMDWAILGIGINVNSLKKDLPAGATSLKEETAQEWDRTKVLTALLKEIRKRYHAEKFEPASARH